MVDRTKPRTALLRANVPWRVYDAIVRRTCLHVDAWLFQAPDDVLYFAFLTSAGGTQEISRTMYRAEPGGLIPVAYDNNALNTGVLRHVDSPWARRNAPWLDALHWSHVVPAISAPVGEPFKGHRSIVLHYVWSDMGVDDPLAGVENMYAVSGRAARDEARMTPERREAEAQRAVDAYRAAHPEVRATWDKAQRSLLRTLDKLLR